MEEDVTDNDDDDWVWMRVQCENHRKPHRIADFMRIDGKWQAFQAATAARRRAQKAKAAEVAGLGPAAADSDIDEWIERAVPAGDRPGHGQGLADGALRDIRSDVEAFFSGTPPRTTWVTYDLTCVRCKRARRHITFRRREDRLWPLLTLWLALGRHAVTPEVLTELATRWDAAQPGQQQRPV
jgi:hypothetical protein